MIRKNVNIDLILNSRNCNTLNKSDLENHYLNYKPVLQEITGINKGADLISLSNSVSNRSARYTDWKNCLIFKKEPNSIESDNLNNLTHKLMNELDTVGFVKHDSFQSTSKILADYKEVQYILDKSKDNLTGSWVYHPQFCVVRELFIEKFTMKNINFLQHVITINSMSTYFALYGSEYHLLYAIGIKSTLSIMYKLHNEGEFVELLQLAKECAHSRDPYNFLPKFRSYVYEHRVTIATATISFSAGFILKSCIRSVVGEIIKLPLFDQYKFEGYVGDFLKSTTVLLEKSGYNFIKLLSGFRIGIINGFLENFGETLKQGKSMIKDVIDESTRNKK